MEETLAEGQEPESELDGLMERIDRLRQRLAGGSRAADYRRRLTSFGYVRYGPRELSELAERPGAWETWGAMAVKAWDDTYNTERRATYVAQAKDRWGDMADEYNSTDLSRMDPPDYDGSGLSLYDSWEEGYHFIAEDRFPEDGVGPLEARALNEYLRGLAQHDEVMGFFVGGNMSEAEAAMYGAEFIIDDVVDPSTALVLVPGFGLLAYGGLKTGKKAYKIVKKLNRRAKAYKRLRRRQIKDYGPGWNKEFRMESIFDQPKRKKGRLRGDLTDKDKQSAELEFAQELADMGNDVLMIKNSTKKGEKSGDMFVNGVKMELKTFKNKKPRRLRENSANDIFAARHQSKYIIVDARQQEGATREMAEKIIELAYNKDKKTRELMEITILTKDGRVTIRSPWRK